MSFRSKMLAPLTLAAGLLISCAQEEVPPSAPPNLKLGGPGRECLSETSQTVDQFIKGNLNENQIRDFWDCLNGALNTFTDYTKGRASDQYTAQEIRAFLTQFFLGDVTITDGMLAAIMEVKRILVGGSVQAFSRTEIEFSKRIIEEIKAVTIELNPHIKIYYRAVTGRDPEKSLDPQKFELAMGAFHKSMLRIGQIVSRQNQDYSFAQLELFLGELYQLVNGSDKDIDLWLRYLPLLSTGKALLVGGSDQSIRGSEWPSVVFVFSHFLQTLARTNVYLLSETFGDQISLSQTEAVFRSLDEVILAALAARDNRTLLFSEINPFLRAIESLYGFPLDLSIEEMEEVVKTVVQQILSPFEIERSSVQGIGLVQWGELKSEFLFWAGSQQLAIDQARMRRVSPNIPETVREEWDRIVVRSPWPVRVDDRGVLVIDWKGESKSDLHSLTQVNWQKSVIRILIARFAQDPERRAKKQFLTEAEVVALQKAVEPIGVALGLFDKGDTSLALRIIREASLFMPRSDGDQTVTFEEGVEYLMYVLSGLQIEAEMFSHLKLECNVQVSDKGETGIEVNCFRRWVINNRNDLLKHLPHMRSYFNPPGGDGLWVGFERFQEETVRSDGFSSAPILRSDIMEMWILLQYIETFFARFDKAQPESTINVPDSLDAYVVYSPYLAVLLEGYSLNAKFRRGLFTYLMKHGKVHFFDDAIGGSVRFVSWVLNERSWAYEADRLRIVQILASLSSIQRNILGLPLLQYDRPKKGDLVRESSGPTPPLRF